MHATNRNVKEACLLGRTPIGDPKKEKKLKKLEVFKNTRQTYRKR